MKTTVDYLRFRTRSGVDEGLAAMRSAFGSVGDLLTLGEPGHGLDGWQHRRPIVLAGDVRIGAVDYGGHHMRGVVRFDLPGDGCEWVQDWQAMSGLVDLLDDARVSRLDLALTFVNGECSHEKVMAAHAAGEFVTGGRGPVLRRVESSDPRGGRTCYVGSRTAAKMLRAYEKGWELLKDVPEGTRNITTGVRIDGHGMVDPGRLYRVEVEFKAKDGCVIPWTAMVDRDAYFAGAYPFCASLLPDAPWRRVQRMPSFRAEVAMGAALENCRLAYGAVLRAAYEMHGRNAEAVLAYLMTEKPARWLVEAGVLTLEPEHD